ncbi:MAG TPA: hypothetical protein VFN25_16740 [Dokdonella sp.]|uniref:CAF17-like 4Fe-4S cluster assembly/insertion protein YgfZ n=1 Tax=Dokdonella sp. TaxID=2291710 RepID=UPI002D7E36FE|nr:hypothetical protein [Dokdonella sp.]HET9034537.1 hypothetical protein [Dokdonella sp.]
MDIQNPLQELEAAVPCLLAEAQILELSGADACTFAHSQFSSDVHHLNIGDWQWSAWLDSNGRVRNLFALLKAGEDHLLAWLPRGQAASMSTALMPFVFRSKVRLQLLLDYGLFEADVAEYSTIPNSTESWALDLPGSESRRTVVIRKACAESIDIDRHQHWIREDIATGLPWISEQNSAEFTSQALGLERLGAVSLKKGCYPGQEIVARLHYRGGNKRGCMRLHVDTKDVPMPGTEIKIESTPPSTGRVLYAVRKETGCEALAVLPLNVAQHVPLTIESGASVKLLTLANHSSDPSHGTHLA